MDEPLPYPIGKDPEPLMALNAPRRRRIREVALMRVQEEPDSIFTDLSRAGLSRHDGRCSHSPPSSPELRSRCPLDVYRSDMRRSLVHSSTALSLIIAACVSGTGVLAGGGANPPAGTPA